MLIKFNFCDNILKKKNNHLFLLAYSCISKFKVLRIKYSPKGFVTGNSCFSLLGWVLLLKRKKTFGKTISQLCKIYVLCLSLATLAKNKFFLVPSPFCFNKKREKKYAQQSTQIKRTMKVDFSGTQ
jgi:hypothetical protein